VKKEQRGFPSPHHPSCGSGVGLFVVDGIISTQLVKTRPYLPTSVKYMALDSFYTKKTIIDTAIRSYMP
jgi:hypothetical protein